MFSETIIMGRLVFEPELKVKKESGKTIKWVCFRMAVNRDITLRGKPKVDFFDCIVFNQKAEFLKKYGTVGTMLIVTGRIEIDAYFNKKNQKIPTIQLRVREQRLVSGWKNSNPEREMEHAQDYPIPRLGVDYEEYVLPTM